MPQRRSLMVPLQGGLLPGSTLMCIWADLPLFVRTTWGSFVAWDFRVDTGAHVTEVSEDWAKLRDIPIHGPVVTWSVTTGSGTTAFTGQLGSIRVRLPLWTGVEFEWPCFFRKNRPPKLPAQLDMAGVIKDIRLIVEGTTSPTARHGILTVEEL
jgi:hypothetical protein